MTRFARYSFCLCVFLSACGVRSGFSPASPYPLASFSRNRVTVEISLVWEENGQTWLEGSFTPEKGYHLYSKDLPRGGVDGLGRPTLIELVPGSRLVSAGELTESVGALQDQGLEGLLVYPEGPVTLRLPVYLPEGQGCYDEQVSITFMACRLGRCSPPVTGELVAVQVPGINEIKP
jgi:hypothetical protein